MTDAPPTGISVLSAPVSIGTLAMDPVVGAAVRLEPEGQISAAINLTRLQSDSVFVGAFSVPDQAYKDFVVTIATPSFIYLNQTAGAVAIDTSGDVCQINAICATPTRSGFFGGQFIIPTGGAFPTTFGGGNLGVSFDLNQSLMETTSPGFLNLDFSQPNALTEATLPRTGEPAGILELVEDFIGTVTAVNSSTGAITIQPTGTAQFGKPSALVATPNSSTVFDNCSPATSACIHVNQTLSVDGQVNPDGTITLLEVDDLNDTTGDEIEGVIATIDSVNQVFVMMIEDKVTSTTSTDTNFQFQLAQGDPVQVIMGSGATFGVDTKGLPVQAANLSTFANFSSLAPGQTVRINVSATGNSTTNTPYHQVTASSLKLRFTRLTGNTAIVTPGSSTFSYDSTTIPAIFGLTGTPQVDVFGGFTRYDGVTDLTTVNVGDSVSIRALFLPKSTPPFFAAKVRKH